VNSCATYRSATTQFTTTRFFLLLETDYQDNNYLPPDYPVTQVQNLSVNGNHILGTAVSTGFHCSEYIMCEDLTYRDNIIANGKQAAYSCSYVDTYQASGNFPAGVDSCLYDSMNRSLLAAVS
jgi:hypothetical protein